MSTGELVSIIVAVATFGLMNLGALLFFLGSMKAGFQDHSRRIGNVEKTVSRHDRELATIKGELV